MIKRSQPIDRGDTPVESDGEAVAQHALIRAAVRKMPRVTRDIFLAYLIEELSYTEISKRTRLSVRAIEREIARAIILIDRALNHPPPAKRWWQRS